MRFTESGAWLQDDLFKFTTEQRKAVQDNFLRGKLKAEAVVNFIDDCEGIVNLWLSIENTEPIKPPSSALKEKLIDIEQKSKSLSLTLASVPIYLADRMNAESMLLDRQLDAVYIELEANLKFLQNLTARCLAKWQVRPSRDLSHIRQLLVWLIKAYIRNFNKKPPKSKNDTNPLYGFLHEDVADAVGEPIGSDLYLKVIDNNDAEFEAYLKLYV